MKKWIKRTLACVCSALVVFSAGCGGSGDGGDGSQSSSVAADTGTVLAENGATDYVIVIPEAATKAEQTAATLLVEQFKEATNATLPIVSDAGKTFNKNDKVISIGRTSILAGSGLSVTVDELTYEGYKLKQEGNTVLLCGAEDSGTIYSVSDFLKAHFAYEVYAIDEIYMEKTDKAFLKEIDIVEIPDFWGRTISGYFEKNPALCSAMRIRSYNIPESYGYGSSRDWIPSSGHTLQAILRPADHPDHPEWFYSGQLCFTAEGMFEAFVADLIKLIVANPYGKIINIAEDDNSSLGKCCDTCKAEVKQYGVSGYLVRFINRVIKAIDEWREENNIERDFYYTTYAYTTGTIIPPVNENKDGTYTIKDESCRPDEKLYMRITPLYPICYSHSWEDESCSSSKKINGYIKGWRAISDHFFVWDYDCSYRCYFMFFDIWDALQENLQLYKEIGVTNIQRQSTTGSTFRSFGALLGYVSSELMWDVDADMNALIDNFFTNYYKNGAVYMKQCFDLLRSHCNMKDEELSYGVHFETYYNLEDHAADWPVAVLEQALALVDKAIASYEELKTTSPSLYNKLYKRALSESVCLRWMILHNYSSYGFSTDTTIYTDMIDQWEKDANFVGATFYGENRSVASWLTSVRAKAS